MKANCRELLENLVKSLEDLIDSSEGVAGLHLNGDIAYWESLQEGGRYDGWLLSLNEAQKFLREEPKVVYAIFCNDSIQRVVKGDEENAEALMNSLKEKYFIEKYWLFRDKNDYETQCLWHIKPTKIVEDC